MKTKHLLFSALLLLFGTRVYSQDNVAINATGALPNASAMLDITSIDKGLLIPRMTTLQRAGIASPATGLLVYDTDEDSFWYFDGTAWSEVGGSTGTSTTPSGVIMVNASSAVPTGWLLCDGSEVSRTTYSELFTAIGTTYGAGNGSTTFNLPDLRGRTPVGKDDMGGSAANRITSGGSGVNGTSLGASGGNQSHTLTTSQMPSHSHTTSIQRVNANLSGSSWQVLINGGGFGATNHGSDSQGGNQAHPIVQPSIIMNYIIKI